MSNIDAHNSNDSQSKRTEAVYPFERTHRSPTLVSSTSSIDSFLMEYPEGPDFFDGMQNAFDSNTIDDSNNGEGAYVGTFQHAMSSNTVSSSSLQDQLPQQQSCSDGTLRLQNVAPSDLGLIQQVVSAPAPATAVNNTVPEFLYQLTKMLTHDNREIIEWSNGRIEVHNPHKLEKQVLNKYFRHSKFASFQRQLNYFGWRKLAGKGKMAPCSYVNDAAGDDIASLLHIKRKGTVMNPRDSTQSNKKKKETTSKRSESSKSRSTRKSSVAGSAQAPAVREEPMSRKNAPSTAPSSTSSGPITHQALARRAVGRGVRHGFASSSAAMPPPARQTDLDLHPFQPQHDSQTAASLPSTNNTDSLSELEMNYRNVLNEESAAIGSSANNETDPTPLSEMQGQNDDSSGLFGGFLSRNSSLVDLAMIAPVDEDQMEHTDIANRGFGFVDFPNPEVHPSNSGATDGN